MVQLNDPTMTGLAGGVIAGSTVYIWCAATATIAGIVHTQGGVEVVASGGNTAQMDVRTIFNGSPDSSGIVEIAFNL